jgi:hypothetical protein
MLDSLKQFKDEDYDSILFMPTEEENQVHFQVSKYKEPGIKLDGSTIGDCYHIILFKEDEEGLVINLDMFEAILMAPLEYISQLLPDEWFGIICKKTTTSEKYVLETFDNLKEVC